MVEKHPGQSGAISTALALMLTALFFISFLVGRNGVSLGQTLEVLASTLLGKASVNPEMVQSVILKVRAPRIIAAVLVGGSLAVAGAVYQGLFRNPMVSPDILGASSGAGHPPPGPDDRGPQLQNPAACFFSHRRHLFAGSG